MFFKVLIHMADVARATPSARKYGHGLFLDLQARALLYSSSGTSLV